LDRIKADYNDQEFPHICAHHITSNEIVLFAIDGAFSRIYEYISIRSSGHSDVWKYYIVVFPGRDFFQRGFASGNCIY